MVPPPAHNGERMLPARARPVRCCRHGSLPPPLTTPFVLAAAVPARPAASWLCTAACRRCSRTGPATTAAGTSTWPAGARLCETTGSVTVPSTMSLLPCLGALADHDRAVARPRHGAAHEEEMLVRAHRDHHQVAGGHALGPVAAGHALALEHAAGVGAVPDRAAVPEVLVRAVRAGEAGEEVPLHDPRRAAPLAHPGDRHPLARLEDVAHLDLAPHRGRLAVGQAELAQHRESAGARLGEVSGEGLRQALRLGGREAHLGGRVALARGPAGGDHGARPGLDDGHRHEHPLRGVDLRHAELSSDEAAERHVALLELDLHVDAGGEVELAEGVDRLLRRLEDVEQALVGADLELLARLLVDVRRAVHGEALDVGGKRDGAGDPPARPAHGLDDLAHRLVEQPVVVRLQADADLVVHARGYSKILVTTPAPTVRPPSRMARRSPSSIAIGVIRSTYSCTLSPGITISVPSGSVHTPVTSVVRK